MWTEIVDLNAFYDTSLGQMVRLHLRRRIRAFWPNVAGEAVLGLGYATPYLRPFIGEAQRTIALMPAQQGVHPWPRAESDERNLVALVEEDQWPLPDLSMDRVLLVHAVENSEALRPMLREAWRVLAGGGKLLVVTPDRRSLWARLERTPFGHSHPYSRGQLWRLLRDNMFSPLRSESALFFPPFRSRMLLKAAPTIEAIGGRWLSFLGGVTLTEASKQVYAMRPIRLPRGRRRSAPVPQPTLSAAEADKRTVRT
ncbi:MAG: class I SAM-dependent methyltransferase [Alphaproteobacteria bacterium]